MTVENDSFRTSIFSLSLNYFLLLKNDHLCLLCLRDFKNGRQQQGRHPPVTKFKLFLQLFPPLAYPSEMSVENEEIKLNGPC